MCFNDFLPDYLPGEVGYDCNTYFVMYRQGPYLALSSTSLTALAEIFSPEVPPK